MMKRVLHWFTREWSGLHQAALLLGLSALASQVLALIRDRLLAATFGAGAELDIYYAAFRIPDFLYVGIASFISASVVIPFLVRKMEQEKKTAAADFLDQLFTAFSVVMIVAGLLALIFMPQLVRLVAPGFGGEAMGQLVILTRILLLSPVLLGLSNLLGAVTQSLRRFFVYALNPILYNLGIIIGIFAFYPVFGLAGLVWGVVLGALLHLLIHLPVILSSGLHPKFTRKINWPELREVVFLSLPRTLTLSTQHLVILVLVALASLLAKGSISVFQFAFNLQSVPLVIFGVSYSVAAFPTLVRLLSGGKRQEFVYQVTSAVRHILFWSLPATVLFVVLRAQIVRVILGSGRFDWSDTRLVAAALALFVVSVAGQGLIHLFVRSYYAAGKTKKPFFINLLASCLTIILALGFLKLFALPWWQNFLGSLLRVHSLIGIEVLSLPLAYSLGIFTNLAIIWFFFQKDFGHFPKIVDKALVQSLFASLLGGVVAYLMLALLDNFLDLNTFFGIFTQGFTAGLLGLLVFAGVLRLLGNQELFEIARSLKSKFWKVKAIAPEQEGL